MIECCKSSENRSIAEFHVTLFAAYFALELVFQVASLLFLTLAFCDLSHKNLAFVCCVRLFMAKVKRNESLGTEPKKERGSKKKKKKTTP